LLISSEKNGWKNPGYTASVRSQLYMMIKVYILNKSNNVFRVDIL